MNKIIKTGTVLLGAIVMARFSLPKLMSAAVSVKSFTYLGEVLNIDGMIFMHVVGATMFITSLLLLSSLFIKNNKVSNHFSLLGFLLLLGLMIGALCTEFFIRPEPIPRLVLIASSMILVALSQIPSLLQKVIKQHTQHSVL